MWLNLPETQIVGVADADAKGLAGALAKLKVGQGFADYREMLRVTKPDLVAIGPRSVGQHREMVLAAVEAGVRGIYMEKPMCASLAEADAMLAACQAKNVKLALAHRNRYQPTLPVVAEMIKAGQLGRLLEVRGRGKEDARGGCVDLWVLGSHVLNVAVYFAGRPTACTATLLQDGKLATPADLREGTEELGLVAGNELHARFETERNIPIFFDSVQNAGAKEAGFGLQLIGTRGVVDFRIDETPVAHFRAGSPFKPALGKGSEWVPITSAGLGMPEPIADLKQQAGGHLLGGRDLIAAIKEDRAPLCSGEDGRVTVEMATAVLLSHVRGGVRVGWPLEARENPLAGWK